MAKSGILAKSQDLQVSFDATTGQITIGIDHGAIELRKLSTLLANVSGSSANGR